MKRIFRYSFSLLLLLCPLAANAQDADTVKASRSLSIGVELTGPVLYSLDRSKYNFEGRLAYRLNYKYFLVIEPGYSGFNFEKHNYEYYSRGMYLRIGTDISLLAPVASRINHFAGIGLRYGLSLFQQATPSISFNNYWGHIDTSVEENSVNAHFIELQGGVKTELFTNVLIGWAVKLRTPLYSSGRNGEKAVYIPGMGSTDSFIAAAVSYYIIYRFPLPDPSGE